MVASETTDRAREQSLRETGAEVAISSRGWINARDHREPLPDQQASATAATKRAATEPEVSLNSTAGKSRGIHFEVRKPAPAERWHGLSRQAPDSGESVKPGIEAQDTRNSMLTVRCAALRATLADAHVPGGRTDHFEFFTHSADGFTPARRIYLTHSAIERWRERAMRLISRCSGSCRITCSLLAMQ